MAQKEHYIVVAYHEGFAYILQLKGVVAGVFYNNAPKVLKTYKTARKEACKVLVHKKCEYVRIFKVYWNDRVSTDIIWKWENEEPERIVCELTHGEKVTDIIEKPFNNAV